MGKNAWIGNFNFIQINKLFLGQNAFIKSRNRIRGPMNILMAEEASISNSNSIYRAYHPVCEGISTLKLGNLGQIISKNHLDCTRSIEIGDNTTIGGLGSQLWTHGFFHSRHGRGRVRVDGAIKIGNNVYVGSRCTFNPGIEITDGVTLGSNMAVAKSLTKPGMYVPQPLRHIDKNINDLKLKLKRVDSITIGEVYEKAVN